MFVGRRVQGADELGQGRRALLAEVQALVAPTATPQPRRVTSGLDSARVAMMLGVLERHGLGFEAVSALNPRVVYCAATGFGQDGPHRHKPCFDDIVQAASGLASLVGAEQGQVAYVPALVADKTAALALANAVLAALFHRERTGQGQYVEVPMFEAMVEFNLAEHMGGMAFEPGLGPAGYGRIVKGGRRPLPTADGHVAVPVHAAADDPERALEVARGRAERVGVDCESGRSSPRRVAIASARSASLR